MPSRCEVDHIVPLSDGGSNAFENLRTTCRPCNQASNKRGREPAPRKW